MKKKIFLFVIGIFTMVSCNDDFFDTAPATSITNDIYWTTGTDFRLYLNSYYTYFTGHSTAFTPSPTVFGDNESDNLVPDDPNTLAAGQYIIPASGGGYNFTTVRGLNILLDQAKTAPLTASILNPYIAEAKFFKAVWYADKVKMFGDYPWLSSEIGVDSPELYGERTPRKAVMDSVLADLNFAIAYLPKNKVTNGYINRNIALAAKSRIFLYEGTWMKYHNAGDPTKFLQASYDASQTLITENQYTLSSSYRTLFSAASKITNPECIMVKDYELNLVTTAIQRQLQDNGQGTGGNNGVSKSLVDAYLDIQGKPISQSTLYDESQGWKTEFNNRDPRLSVTVSAPGTDLIQNINPPIRSANNTNIYGNTTTGYYIEKHWERNLANYNLAQKAAYDAIIYRYGEVLLNYAEAAYELGILDQAKVNLSINRLRARVGMPNMNIATLVKDINSDFPSINVVLDEIRRERRVELALENFRYDDLMRWKAGSLLTKTVRGMKFIPSMYPKINIATSTVLKVDANGYLLPYYYSLPQGRVFDENKNYLFPLPLDELTMNPKLKQNPGWRQ